jgi:hypothetical protein
MLGGRCAQLGTLARERMGSVGTSAGGADRQPTRVWVDLGGEACGQGWWLNYSSGAELHSPHGAQPVIRA